MTRKGHNHTLQTNQRHREEEAINHNSLMASRRDYCKTWLKRPLKNRQNKGLKDKW